jgi:hypothetical protein
VFGLQKSTSSAWSQPPHTPQGSVPQGIVTVGV